MNDNTVPSKAIKKRRLADYIGIFCGLFLVAVLVLSCVFSGAGKRAGVPNSQLPDDAVTLYGESKGRNDVIKVKVVVAGDKICQIKVLDNSETSGIGQPAVNYIPAKIYDQGTINVDALTGATITSDAIKDAICNALLDGGYDPYKFGSIRVLVNEVAEKVKTGTKVTVLTANDWAEEYPDIYASFMANANNSTATDYLMDYPMLKTLYNDFGFAKYYSSARGHYYDVDDIMETGRPHKMANCFTCKTADFTATVNQLGDSAYSILFEDMAANVNEGISCYNCHANTPGQLTVTHSYLTDALGEDFENVDAATLSCAQCHVEYYFGGEFKATMLPYSNLDTMNPDDILEFYNNMGDKGFADYTNPDTGVRQIKVQHPEFETFAGTGSQHRAKYTCADCHMGDAKAADKTTYKNHELTSPLDNEALIQSECSTCHEDLVTEVRELQADVEVRTNDVGNKLVDLTNKLADAVKAEKLDDATLKEVRQLARNAQFYWDFVFVENSEGAHNSRLTYQCLDKADALADEALALIW